MVTRTLSAAVGMAASIILPAMALAGSGSGVSVISSPAPQAELTVAPPSDFPDVRLLSGYVINGHAALNPTDPKRLVMGIGFPGDSKCYVKRSADGGKTWGPLVVLPHPSASGISFCAGPAPAVAYSADGSHLYAAYTYEKKVSSFYTFVVAVTVSVDQGATWSLPTSAFIGGDAGEDTGFVDVQLATQADDPALYMTGNFRGVHGRFLYFSSSRDRGSSWTPAKQIVVAFPDEGTDLHDFALAAGRHGNVFVAYGWSEVPSSFIYRLQVARSTDHGNSFLYRTADEYSSATSDGSLLLTQPDIAIGLLGTAQLVYNKGSEAILYKYSVPPYKTWSAMPARLDDDVSAAELSAPRLAVGACGAASILHASWAENRPGTGRIVYTRKVAQPGYAWSDPLTVGRSNRRLGGSDLVGAGAKAFSIWEKFESAGNLVIFGSRVASGVTCP